MTPDTTNTPLLRLASDEVPPVLEENVQGSSPFLFTCDHYGRLIPHQLKQLGLSDSELTRHIAWDIGIAGVATTLARTMNAHLIAQRYSRLVIDCNRSPHVPSSIPIISEATTIPGNEGLLPEEAEIRRQLIFEPYHRRIGEIIDRRLEESRPTILVSLHSFTPTYAGITRPWHVGMLYYRGRRLNEGQSNSHSALALLLLRLLRAEGDLLVGDNEPYAVSEETDYTIPVHGEKRGLMNMGIEIRQDLIAESAGQQQWAERLARIFNEIEAMSGGVLSTST